MINLNAATLSNNVIGLPLQQIIGGTTNSGNAFQALIQNLLNNDNPDNSSVLNNSNLAAQVQANPKTQAAVFQAVTTLFILGNISSAANSTTGQLSNNPVVNKIIQDNNLTPAEAQLAVKGIKAASEQLLIGITREALAGNKVNDIDELLQPEPYVCRGSSSNAAATPAAPDKTPANTQADNIPAVDPSGKAIIAVKPPVSVENTVQPVQLTENAVNNNPNAGLNTDIKISQPLNPQNLFLPVPAAGGSEIQPLTPVAVNPAVNTGSPALVNARALKPAVTQSHIVQPVLTVSEQARNLIMELKSVISDLNALLSPAVKKDTNTGDSLKQIAAKINELTDKIDQLSSKQPAGSQAIKDITGNAANILAAIGAALNTAAASAVNNAATGGNDADTTDLIATANNGAGTSADNARGRQIEIAVNTANDAQGLLGKISSLLKAMNGSVQVLQETVYIYNPGIPESLYMGKDGITVINLAVTGTGLPVAKQGSSQATVPADNIDTTNKNNSDPQAIIQEVTPEQTAITAGLTEASVNPTAINTVSNDQAVLSNTGKTGNVATSAVVPAGSPVNPVKINPVPENIEEQPSVPAGTDNNANLQKAVNAVKDIDWMAGEMDAALTAAVNNNTVQGQNTIKLFDEVAQFAKDTRDNLVIKQVITTIRDTVQVSRQTEVKITLRPENLGTVVVKLDSRDNVINGKIEVANADVRDVLKASLPELKAALNNMGLNVDKFDVSMMQNNSNNIGSGMNDRGSNHYREWDGGIFRPDAEQLIENSSAYAGANGNLNFLA